MRIIITGSPGTGKTAVAKLLGKRLKCAVLNEHDFCMRKGIGKFEGSELIVPLGKLRKALNAELKRRRNIIAEGHLLCEIKLGADAAVLLRLHPELLEARLEKRGYNAEKIQDNVFCEGIDYCKKHLHRNFGKGKIIEVSAHGTAKETANIILNKLKEKSDIG
ncbi:MAG: AAA family ATPase [Candidatus Diapherotrites archaeon]|nr:AAA family ATPase [Candidatus Diapherotrites archaeon]